MGCVIYYLYGEAIPALMAEAKLKGGGAAQALNEALIDGNEIIAKFDGATELPNHHRELICIAHLIPGVRIHVADDPKLTAEICTHLEAIRARLRQRNAGMTDIIPVPSETLEGEPMTKIDAWSYSRLSTFEQCKLRAKLAYIDRIPEPERPLPPGKTEHANDRGTRVHNAAEMFVQGGVELIPELRTFREEFLRLRELYKQGKVSLEGEWAVDRDWEPTAWRSSNAWARIKLDAFVRMSKTHGVVIDYKTGKKFGNEIKHAEQCQLYQLAAFLRYPELQVIDVELWYTDQDDITHMRYTRDQGMRFYRNFDNRGNAITTATDFPANPNMFSCRWCPYGPRGTGHCTKGV